MPATPLHQRPPQEVQATYHLLTKVVRLDGAVQSVPPRVFAKHDRISYDYVTINTLDVVQPAHLTNVKPWNRPTEDAEIGSARPGDLAIAHIDRSVSPAVVRIYQLSELTPYDDCGSGEGVLGSIVGFATDVAGSLLRRVGL